MLLCFSSFSSVMTFAPPTIPWSPWTMAVLLKAMMRSFSVVSGARRRQ